MSPPVSISGLKAITMEDKIITLSNGEKVSVASSLTWGQKEEINNVYIKGAKLGANGMDSFDTSVLQEGKYKLLEMCINSISLPGGEVKFFSREWMDNLSCEDGDLVFEVVSELTKKKAN